MAYIHIKEIMQILQSRGEEDASIYGDKQQFFLEVSCEDEQATRIATQSDAIDIEYANQVLSVNSPFGTVLILFDAVGMLKTIEFS